MRLQTAFERLVADFRRDLTPEERAPFSLTADVVLRHGLFSLAYEWPEERDFIDWHRDNHDHEYVKHPSGPVCCKHCGALTEMRSDA